MRRETSSGVELGLKEGPSSVQKEGELAVAKDKEVSSKKIKVSLWMISIGKRKENPWRAVKAARKARCEEQNLNR